MVPAWTNNENWRLIFFSKNNGELFGVTDPKKDLLDLLVKKTMQCGHMITFDEASADPDMVKPNSYAFYFGSYSVAAEKAWKIVKLEAQE